MRQTPIANCPSDAPWILLAAMTLALTALGCGSEGGGDTPDAGPDVIACDAEEPGVIEPVWIAGGAGPRADTGGLEKPDAIFLTPDGILLVGDEAADRHELLLFDVTSEDPTVAADPLTPLVDFGADPGPAGTGPLEFDAISGFAQSPIDGRIFVVEQGNSRVQILRPAADPNAPPYLEFEGFFGARAADPDNPADGEFVRLQAARTDSAGRLYLTDDAKGFADTARRDVQIFSPELAFVAKLGDESYGPLGRDGNLQEPENFVLDEGRRRIYVTDEGPKNVAVYDLDGYGFIQRFGGGLFTGIPNGIDVDQAGYLYVMDEGAGQIRVFEPDEFSEVYRFGALTDAADLTPGTFASADTLIIDTARDLLIVTDQGHRRIQGFRLSDIQRRACVPVPSALVVTAPARAIAGQVVTARAELHGGRGFGAVDRSRTATATVTLRSADGAPINIGGGADALELVYGAGSVSVRLPDTVDGDVELTVAVDGLETTRVIGVDRGPAERALSGTLAGADLVWGGGDVIRIADEVVVPAGETLLVEAGARVLLDGAARITVQGALDARGTSDAPISVTAADPAAAWGQIEAQVGATSFDLRYVHIAGGGDATKVGHCCGPVLLVRAASARIEDVVIADSPGKGLYTDGVDLAIARTQLARLGMGAEVRLGRGTIVDTHFLELRGADDNDGIYFDRVGEYRMARSVIAGGDDDGIDSEFSAAQIADVIVSGFADKCLSFTGGAPHIRDSLIIGCNSGAVIKDHLAESPARPVIETTTLAAHAAVGVAIADVNADADIAATLRALIVWDAPASVTTDYPPENTALDFCDLEHEAVISGEGNFSADPRFVDAARGDYRLAPGSPAATAGPDGGAIGWPGW